MLAPRHSALALTQARASATVLLIQFRRHPLRLYFGIPFGQKKGRAAFLGGRVREAALTKLVYQQFLNLSRVYPKLHSRRC